MENKNISFDSQIGKEEKSKKPIIILAIVIALCVISVIGYVVYRKSNITEIAIGLSDIELTDEIKGEMKTLLENAEKYYDENINDSVLVSQYGLLYNYRAKMNVMASDIVEKNSKLSNKEIAEMDILFVRGDDVVEGLGEELELFMSINSSSGYYVLSKNGDEATFNEKEFKNLLMKYAPTHNNIVNPSKESDIYLNILNAAGIVNMDIKHIACDDKYAVVVAGGVENPKDLREIALINEDGWKVIDKDLAKSQNPYVEINNNYPDMDLGLMPIYNISEFDEIVTDGLEEYINALVEIGLMDESEKEGAYAVNCGRFTYVQAKNGNRYVGYLGDDNNLEFNKATNIEESINLMLAYDKNPPVFIAIFN